MLPRPSLLALLASAAAVLSSPQAVFSSPATAAAGAKPGSPAPSPNAFPASPLSTRGRDIVDAHGNKVHWAGVNWPMSGETMVFEGLEYASAEQVLDDVKSVGFNFIRAGYAIEMIDQIYDRNGQDVPLLDAMVAALGEANGTAVTDAIVKNNPRWSPSTTRFQILGDVADLAAQRGIYIHPDVHVGKAQWCCSHTDGNAWFDDINFSAANWTRGLSYMAKFAKNHRAITSMSLRNELRSSWNDTTLMYDWVTLVGNMSAGADAIHSANPDLLITWSGMQYDEDLSALTSGANLLTAPAYKADAIRDRYREPAQYFDLGKHAWGNKIVYELHLYDGSEMQDTGRCDIIQAELYRNGFNALGIEKPDACSITKDCPNAVSKTPVILSEFGHAQDDTIYSDLLQNCLRDFTTKHGVSWAMWSLAGSYRTRQGVVSFDDTWGLTNHDWSGWRAPDVIDKYWKKWVAQTLGSK